MQTGDIVLIPFPFSGFSNVKIRPALVIRETKDRHNDLVLCAISSQVSLILSENEYIVQPDSLNNLRTESIIRVDRIFTMKKENVIAILGKLNVSQLKTFKTIFKSLVD